jgi:uncharacterized protein (TIGR02444 family)
MATKKTAAAESFWRFSLMLYSRPNVAAALIGLQDKGGHNVNLILFGLWRAICGRAGLDAAGLARSSAAIAALDRDVVMPLRRLQRELKGNADPDIPALRGRVLALEIAAERRVQARLAANLPRPSRAKAGDRAAIAEANLRLILGADWDAPQTAILIEALAEP